MTIKSRLLNIIDIIIVYYILININVEFTDNKEFDKLITKYLLNYNDNIIISEDDKIILKDINDSGFLTSEIILNKNNDIKLLIIYLNIIKYISGSNNSDKLINKFTIKEKEEILNRLLEYTGDDLHHSNINNILPFLLTDGKDIKLLDDFFGHQQLYSYLTKSNEYMTRVIIDYFTTSVDLNENDYIELQNTTGKSELIDIIKNNKVNIKKMKQQQQQGEMKQVSSTNLFQETKETTTKQQQNQTKVKPKLPDEIQIDSNLNEIINKSINYIPPKESVVTITPSIYIYIYI